MAMTGAMNQQLITQMARPTLISASPRANTRSARPVPKTAANATYVVDTGNPRPDANAITLALTEVITEALSVS